jgi:Mg-chelatase subunit ChlD
VIHLRARRYLAFALFVAAAACRDDSSAQPPLHAPPAVAPTSRAERRLDAALAPATPVEERPGLAAMVLIDVSGSMEQRIRGERTQKIEVARRAALDLVEQFARYATDHPKETVRLSVAEFSARDGESDVREVIPMGAPDLDRARAAIAAMRAEGGTPIGTAVVHAKRALDATGLARRHLLVVTDGENTNGDSPEDVVAAIGRRPQAEHPSIYFVAFDIDASRFDDVRNAGGLVLPAGSGKALGETIDSLLRGKILVEK